jgi:hypothetical protein
MLDKIKCNDLVNPQIKPPEIEMTQVKDGINVTLQKVEFTPNETKAFLSVKNINSNETHDVLFYETSDSVILAGEKQYEIKFSSENPGMKSTIPAGKEETRVLVFESIDQNQSSVRFQFVMSKAYSDDSRFEFVVPVS